MLASSGTACGMGTDMVAGRGPVFRCPSPTHMGLLETAPAHRPSPDTVERLPEIAGKKSGLQLRTNGRCYLAGRRSNAQRGSRREEINGLSRQPSPRSAVPGGTICFYYLFPALASRVPGYYQSRLRRFVDGKTRR